MSLITETPLEGLDTYSRVQELGACGQIHAAAAVTQGASADPSPSLSAPFPCGGSGKCGGGRSSEIRRSAVRIDLCEVRCPSPPLLTTAPNLASPLFPCR